MFIHAVHFSGHNAYGTGTIPNKGSSTFSFLLVARFTLGTIFDFHFLKG
jgi:hypothetical protein